MPVDVTDLPDVSELTVGILGGTGDQGRGLAYRLARAGQRVLIGSRTASRGQAAAAELSTLPWVPAGGGSRRGNPGPRAPGGVLLPAPRRGPPGLLAALRAAPARPVRAVRVHP